MNTYHFQTVTLSVLFDQVEYCVAEDLGALPSINNVQVYQVLAACPTLRMKWFKLIIWQKQEMEQISDDMPELSAFQNKMTTLPLS